MHTQKCFLQLWSPKWITSSVLRTICLTFHVQRFPHIASLWYVNNLYINIYHIIYIYSTNTATLPHPCTPHPRTPRAPTLPQPHQADAGEIAQPSQVQNHRNAAVETCEKSVKSSPPSFLSPVLRVWWPHPHYCWWKKSGLTSWYGKYPIIYRVSYIPGGCLGFLPSTVWLFFGSTPTQEPHDGNCGTVWRFRKLGLPICLEMFHASWCWRLHPGWGVDASNHRFTPWQIYTKL